MGSGSAVILENERLFAFYQYIQEERTMMVLYRSIETCTYAYLLHDNYWHSGTMNNLKTFLVASYYVQVKSVKICCSQSQS